MPLSLYTIGVYGSTEESFFGALESAGIRTFCDLRRRRGLRGSEYLYANSNRLQSELARRGIRYFHILDLAPSTELRARQAASDKASGTTRRKRDVLAGAFADAYREECLAEFDSAAFVAWLGPEPGPTALFCVEREPRACHRSLVAERLEQDLGIGVAHLIP